MSGSRTIQWQPVPGRRRPALRAAVLLGAGIIVARYLPVMPLVWGMCLAGGAVVLLTLARRRPAVLFLTMLGVWLALGAFRYATETQIQPPDHISRFPSPSQKIEIFGRIADLPDRRIYATNLILEVRSLDDNNRRIPVSGRILVRVRDTARHFSYGDFLRFTGDPARPPGARNPGGFDYRRYLHDRGIHAVVDVPKNSPVTIYPDPGGAIFFNQLVIPLREHILSIFRQYLPGVAGTMLAGYLIGETREMPDELYDAYRRSGTLHLLAVSGSNVWLVLGVFWLMFRALRFPRLMQIFLLLGILVVFCFVTRNDPSVVRAGVMAALVLLGILFRQRIDMLNIVGASAVIILLFSPRHLFLAGFQLSYAAVLGILILVPRFLQLFPGVARRRAGRWVLTLAGSSVAATASTAPILALHFGVIPVISVLANLVMVPLAAVLTNCAVLLVLLGDLWPQGAQTVAWFARLLADLSIWCVQHFKTIPLGLIYWAQPGVAGMMTYLLVLTAVVASRYWYRWIKPAVFYGLSAAGIFLGSLAISGSAPPVELMFFETRWQSLIAIRLPGERPRLVGTAGAFSPANQEWVIEPFLTHAGWPREVIEYDTIPRRPALPAVVLPATSTDSVVGEAARRGSDTDQLRFVYQAGSRRIPAADYLSAGGSGILILYHDDPDLVRYIDPRIKSQPVNVLAVPSALPSVRLLEALGRYNFGALLLFGPVPPGFPHGVGGLWARHFPGHSVYTTEAHRGLRVFLDGSVRIIPTVP